MNSMGKSKVSERPPPYSAAVFPTPMPQPQPASAPDPPRPPGYTSYRVPPPRTGFVPPRGTGVVPNYGATSVRIPPHITTVGACPACRVGVLENDYTCLGILCAILFFPLGILFCLASKNRRCSNCGTLFG